MNSKNARYYKLLAALSLMLMLLCMFPKRIEAADASLSIFPQTGSFTAGNTFEVSVFINTGGNNINVAKVDLKFNPEKLQVITPTKGISIVGEWIFPPSFSNTQGTVSLIGGFLFDGINTTEGLITTIVFEAVSPGESEVYFLDSCKILVGGEGGTDILSSVNRGAYNILPPPFKGPRIFSETHPDQNRWYKNNSPSFSWDKIEGAEGYSFRLDDDPFGEPDNTINTQLTSISLEDVSDGIQYFHLKGKREGVWGGTSHFKTLIDTSPPLEFKPRFETFSFLGGNDLLIYFSTADVLSGTDNYKIKISDLTDPENIVFSGWLRVESPFRLSKQEAGTFNTTIRAFDKAGNFQEGGIQIRVINPFLIITSEGIQIIGISLSWWQVYFIVTAVFASIGYLLFGLLRRRKESLKIDLQKEIREAEKEIEDVKRAEEKLKRLRIKEEKAGREWKRLKENLEEEIE